MHTAKRVIVWLSWGTLFYLTGLSYIDNTTALSYDTKRNITFLLPQGWAFFTKNPKEALVEIYRLKGKNQLELVTYNNASAANLFGFSRRSRAVSYQLSGVIGSVPRQAWTNGIGGVSKTLNNRVFPVKLKERLTYFQEGTYLIYQFKPIPLEWANQGQEQYRPNLSAIIKISY